MGIKYNYIAIEGCIGAGKTTLAKKLADDFNAELILESFEDNCFLPKFYKDPVHYAFPVEMTFLTERYQQLKTLLSKRDLFKDLVIADYFLDKCIIFSKNNLQNDEYGLYTKVYTIISSYLPKPDLIIYLYHHADQLLHNIRQRGREYEKNITAGYLNDIQNSYMNYLEYRQSVPVLVVEAHHLDFVNNKADYEKIKGLLENDYPQGMHRIIF